MTRHGTVRDGYGTAHSGPRGAWWLPIRDGSNETGARRRSEIPTFRLRAWNVAAVVYAAAATVLTWRLGELAPLLVILGAMITTTGAGLWWLTATLPARYAHQIGQPAPKEPQPASPGLVEARPLVEATR